ncbi:MAG: metallophosphoesterase family protein [Actinomycetota bacterium]
MPERSPVLPIILRALAALAVGAGGATLALLLAGRLRYPIGPFTVEFHARPGAAVSELALPPLGEIRADTHLAPLTLRATLQSIDPDELSHLVRERSVESLVLLVERAGAEAFRSYAVRAAAFALAGSAVAALIVYRRDRRAVIGTLAAGALFVTALGGVTVITYRPEAFQEPTYTGSLRLAPELIGPIEEAGARIAAFRTELDRLVRGTVRAYGELAAQPAPTEDATVVLHISDIHASPLGMDFAQQLATTFQADLVIDTGDITSFGSRLESSVLERIPQFGVPYVFVRGNHDSVAVASQIESLPNGETLESETVAVEGIAIAGGPHPLFTPNRATSYTDEEIAEAVAVAGAALAAQLVGTDPDVVAVHDDRMAEALAGEVPLVISGHFHRFGAEVRDGTLFLRTGSTGAGGLDTFLIDEPLPLAAEILYFEGFPARLVAIDRITLEPETRELRAERELLSEVEEESQKATARTGPVAPTPPG